jgi:hypothetical protein
MSEGVSKYVNKSHIIFPTQIFYQSPAVEFKSTMQTYFECIIIVDFEVTSYLLIIFSAFLKYLRQIGTQRSNTSVVLRLEENL